MVIISGVWAAPVLLRVDPKNLDPSLRAMPAGISVGTFLYSLKKYWLDQLLLAFHQNPIGEGSSRLRLALNFGPY